MRLATQLAIGLILDGILAPTTGFPHELFVVCQDDASLIRIDTRRETVTARIGRRAGTRDDRRDPRTGGGSSSPIPNPA